MPGSDPNEEGLRAIGRAIDQSRRHGGRGPAPSNGGRAPGPNNNYGNGARRGPAHATSRGGPPRTPRGAAKPPKKRRRWLRRTIVIALAVIVIAVGTGAGYGFYLDHKVHRITVHGLSSAPPATGKDAGTENILMVGSTTRCGLKQQTPAYGLCTAGVTGVNSDVVMILHLNPATHAVSIISIPRDLFIPNSRKTGAYKIDAALAQGPSQLVAAIEEDFAIPIQHYVELNFDTFASVVTALGGITMEFPVPIFDRYSGLRVFTTGCHHLDGKEALQVVRARHLQHKEQGTTPTTPSTWPQEGQSDLARIRRDHEFLRVLATKVAKRGLGNPGSDLSLVSALAPQLTVDSGLSASAMVNLVLTYHRVNVNSAPQVTLPVRVGTFGTYTYKGGQYGDIEFPTEPLDHQVLQKALGLGPDTNTMTGKPLPKPRNVTVSVLNGTGGYDQATKTSSALGALGFHMVGVGTTTPVGQESETLVTYAQRTPADVAAAQLVADSLSGAVVLDYGKTTDGADVTVTTGTDYSVDTAPPGVAAKSPGTTTTAPSTPTSSTGTSAGSTTSSTSSSTSTTSTGRVGTTTSSNSFTAASPASQPLQPWDPRACPAGVTGNTGNW